MVVIDSFSCCISPDNKLYKVMKKGRLRIEKEMNVIKILKNIRKLRILTKANIPAEDEAKTKQLVKNSYMNLIILDSENSHKGDYKVQNHERREDEYFDHEKRVASEETK